MTAHRHKPTITAGRVRWCADYYTRNPAWGVFHVALNDGNYNCGAADHTKRPNTGCYVDGKFVPERWDVGRDEWPSDLREAAEWFDQLTPSQRRSLWKKVEQLLHAERRTPVKSS